MYYNISWIRSAAFLYPPQLFKDSPIFSAFPLKDLLDNIWFTAFSISFGVALPINGIPAPSSATLLATKGWSPNWGTTIKGTPLYNPSLELFCHHEL